MQKILTSIPNCLHFVHVVFVNYVIKGCVELVEKVHHLVGSTGTRQLCETHYVTVPNEENKKCIFQNK